MDGGIERYRDALLRHTLAYLEDPNRVNEESGPAPLGAYGLQYGVYRRIGERQ